MVETMIKDNRWKMDLELGVINAITNPTTFGVEERTNLRNSINQPINESRMIDDTRRRTQGRVSGLFILGE